MEKRIIPFLSLQAINAQYGDQLKSAAAEVIDSGWYIKGSQEKQLSQAFSESLNGANTVLVSNGLDALRIIFRVYLETGKLQKGDEVIVPGHTFIASVIPLTEMGLVPVLVDILPDSYQIDTACVEARISSKTKAILNVHLYGEVSWSSKLRELIARHDLIHIEDNAQAIGAHYNDKPTGTLGDSAAFSFYPGKNLGALGDAGAISTNDKAMAEAFALFSNYGSAQKYHHSVVGYNHRMDEIQAAFLRIKLEQLENESKRRQDIAELYFAELSKVTTLALPPKPKERMTHVWHLFVVRTNHRGLLQKHLKDHGVETLIHYPIPVHKQACYAQASFAQVDLPEVEKHCDEALSLPMGSHLSDEDVRYICAVIRSFTI